MGDRSLFFILTFLSCYFFSNPCYSTTDTLQQGQHFKDWDELVSSNKVFTLKFFGFGTSICPYLGIFYQNYPHETRDNRDRDGNHNGVVWVANRNNPIPDLYGKLMIDANGKLTILSGAGTVLDLYSPTPVSRNASAILLDSGNLVLQELYPDGSVKQVLWQSFDYPTDTLLPGMKLGVNLKTGHRWSLTSWRSPDLPADGPCTITGDANGTSQLVISKRGNITWRSGPWQNSEFKNTNLQSSGPDVRFYYISSETEQSFTYLTKTYDSFPALRIYLNGQLKGSTINLEVQCHSIDSPGPGCVEDDLEKLECRNDYNIFPTDESNLYWPYSNIVNHNRPFGYINNYNRPYGYILVDEYVYDESYNLTLYDCKRICWTNCSCTAFTSSTESGAGCKTYGGMIYNREKFIHHKDMEYYVFNSYLQEMMNQDKNRDQNQFQNKNKNKNKNKKWIWLMIGVGSLAPLLSCYLVDQKYHVRGKAKKFKNLLLPKLLHMLRTLLHKLRRFYNNIRRDKKMNNELRYFTFQSILSATNKFSSTNKLGEGGFGAVYKGKLVDGQEVAVKRLSSSSAQGIKEFKNETELIVKLQHTNLVRLLGCCIEKQEKILVYEYMPNNSLDFFLFDPRKTGLLDWNNRFVIIEGIAQGLLYLHKFSRLRVIHRDLKASNILLDDYLKPKISDFGMAKLFGINESEANTSRVVGTRGYMPPEYMREGTVSTKTDVFSFGVLLLEIVSGKLNHASYDVEHPLNLLGLAWELWKEGRGLELMDAVLEDSCTPKEVMTCIHVGLLCVQDHATDRPTMSEVISMLTNENMNLPDPKQPAFFIERCEEETEAAIEDSLGNGSVNGQSVSIVVAR